MPKLSIFPLNSKIIDKLNKLKVGKFYKVENDGELSIVFTIKDFEFDEDWEISVPVIKVLYINKTYKYGNVINHDSKIQLNPHYSDLLSIKEISKEEATLECL